MNRIVVLLMLLVMPCGCKIQEQTPEQVVESYLTFLVEGECEEAMKLCVNSAKENFICEEYSTTVHLISNEMEGDTSIVLCKENGPEKESLFGLNLIRYEQTWLIDHFFKVPQGPINHIKTHFENYVDEIPEIDIPYNSDNYFEPLDINSEFRSKEAMLHGKLNSINNYHFIIYWYAADISLPILEVYNNKGEKVNQIQLLDMNFESIEYPNQYSRFKIEKTDEIILENYSLIKDVENAVSTYRVKLVDLIK